MAIRPEAQPSAEAPSAPVQVVRTPSGRIRLRVLLQGEHWLSFRLSPAEAERIAGDLRQALGLSR